MELLTLAKNMHIMENLTLNFCRMELEPSFALRGVWKGAIPLKYLCTIKGLSSMEKKMKVVKLTLIMQNTLGYLKMRRGWG